MEKNPKKFLKKFYTYNPLVKERDITITKERIQWTCGHGIPHTIWHSKNYDIIHGCDMCCKKLRL